MEKKYRKKGITLIEVITAITIFGVVAIIGLNLTTKMVKSQIKHETIFDETVLLNNCYMLFNADAVKFKNSIETAYPGKWENDVFTFLEHDKIQINYMENEKEIIVYILFKGEKVEQWYRKKVTP